MPFEIPENIPRAARAARVDGRQLARQRARDYPTIEGFQFGQELVFQQDGRPFVHYFSRAWIVDDNGDFVRNAAQETGFLRPQADRTVEVVMAHNTGFVEVSHGEIHPDQPRFEMVTDTVARTATAKAYTAGEAARRVRRGGPALRLRHGCDGSGDPAAHLGPSAARRRTGQPRWSCLGGAG